MAYGYIPIFFVASITRVESIYFLAPILVLFMAIILLMPEVRHKWHMFGILGATLILWSLFNFWRYATFGSLMPNTGEAQQKDLAERLPLLLDVASPVFSQALNLMGRINLMHYGYLAVLTTPLLYFVRRERIFLSKYLLLLCWIMLSLLYPFIFGAARLEETRTTTHMALFVVVLITLVLYQIHKRIKLIIIPLFVIVASLVSIVNFIPPFYACCETAGFEGVRHQFDNLQQTHDLFRPTVANPDLGVVSWSKAFNIVDLGLLGSPMLVHIGDDWLVRRYLFEIAAPDFIEIHMAWSCSYHTLFEDSRFYDLYEPVVEERDQWLKANCAQYPAARSGIYVRKDIQKGSASSERVLIDDLRADLSLKRISTEISKCSQSSKPTACLYVVRTIYRFLPEIRAVHLSDQVSALFSSTPVSPYATALMGSDRHGTWYQDVIAYLQQLDLILETTAPQIGEGGGFKIYQHNDHLSLVQQCATVDLQQTFFLHVTPTNPVSLPADRIQYGFEGLDFGFDSNGRRVGEMCIAKRSLPQYAIGNIYLGQYDPKTGKQGWVTSIDIPNH